MPTFVKARVLDNHEVYQSLILNLEEISSVEIESIVTMKNGSRFYISKKEYEEYIKPYVESHLIENTL